MLDRFGAIDLVPSILFSVLQTLFEEIDVNLPMRNNPLERRKLAEVGPLVSHLMSLLNVGNEEFMH